MPAPVLTLPVFDSIRAAARDGLAAVSVSLDLGRSTTEVAPTDDSFAWRGERYAFPERLKDRTIYCWSADGFVPAARFSTALYKLVPTDWGPPTFEIDGIKMLPTAQVSPWADAERKVALVAPQGKVVLDTCGGLGYFAVACLAQGARQVLSFEKSADVLWLRTLNPWSPMAGGALEVTHGDITQEIGKIAARSVGSVLHDPPRFGIAGELYSQVFYDELARVLVKGGRLFHYTGTPNKLTSGRDVPTEVAKRLKQAGFATDMNGDGVLATRR